MNKHCEYLDRIEDTFGNHFSQRGYLREEPVAVSSQIDPSVDLVGSKISPLKRYVLNGDIPSEGLYLIQDCFRTRGIKDLKTVIPGRYGSCFRTMGTLTNPDVQRVIFDTFDYLVDGIGIMPPDLMIRMNAEDRDLVAATSAIAGNIRRQEEAPDTQFRHTYGLDGISGRNFNIAVRRHGTDEFANVGTVVLMEQDSRNIAVDMGIGNLLLAMCNFGCNNTLAASRMADVFNIDSIERQRFADSLTGLAILQREGAHEFSYHSEKGRIREKYKKYQDAVVYWKSQLGLSDEQVLEYMQRYIALEFKDNSYKSEATWLK